MSYRIDFDIPTMDDVLEDVSAAIYDSGLPGEYHLATVGRTVHVCCILPTQEEGDRVVRDLPAKIDAACDENRVVDFDGDTHDASAVADFVLTMFANTMHPFVTLVNTRRQAGEPLPSPEFWQRVWTRND